MDVEIQYDSDPENKKRLASSAFQTPHRSGSTGKHSHEKRDAPMADGGEDTCCSICLDPLEGKAVFVTACKHRFHFSCIRDSVLRSTESCPLCRRSFENMTPPTMLASKKTRVEQAANILDENLRSNFNGNHSNNNNNNNAMAASVMTQLLRSQVARREHLRAMQAAHNEQIRLNAASSSNNNNANATQNNNGTQNNNATARVQHQGQNPQQQQQQQPRHVATINNWVYSSETKRISGVIADHPRFITGQSITTAGITSVVGNLINTRTGSSYRLGTPGFETPVDFNRNDPLAAYSFS